jgi:hypothetical protein
MSRSIARLCQQSRGPREYRASYPLATREPYGGPKGHAWNCDGNLRRRIGCAATRCQGSLERTIELQKMRQSALTSSSAFVGRRNSTAVRALPLAMRMEASCVSSRRSKIGIKKVDYGTSAGIVMRFRTSFALCCVRFLADGSDRHPISAFRTPFPSAGTIHWQSRR